MQHSVSSVILDRILYIGYILFYFPFCLTSVSCAMQWQSWRKNCKVNADNNDPYCRWEWRYTGESSTCAVVSTGAEENCEYLSFSGV